MLDCALYLIRWRWITVLDRDTFSWKIHLCRFWCSVSCLVQMYFSMLLPFSTWWCHTQQNGPGGVLREAPLLADCHSCKIQLQPITSKHLCSCVLGQVSFPNFCQMQIMIFEQKNESSFSFLPSFHRMRCTLCPGSHFWDKSVHLYTEQEFNFVDTGQKAKSLHLVRSFMHSYGMELMLFSKEKSVSKTMNCWYMFTCYQKSPNTVCP